MSIHFGDRRLPERFWVNIRVEPGEKGEHWFWTGGTGQHGRPVYTQRRRPWHPRRAAYDALVMPLAPTTRVVGTCEVRGCCHPYHAEVTTAAGAGARSWAHRTEPDTCKRGHDLNDLDPKNVLRARGRRYCLKCRRLREEERRRSRRLAKQRRTEMERTNS
jgi:hypothetical protein